VVRNYALLLFFSTIQIVNAQNLVVNASFELFDKLPIKFSSRPEEFSLPGWNSPSNGTPDHYHANSMGETGVPNNWAGKSNAHSGNAYVGIYAGSLRNSYREYIQGKLIEPLQKGETYGIEFYFKLSSNALYSGSRIGLILSDSLQFFNHSNVIEILPSVNVVRPPLDAGNWELANTLYKAKGGEHYIIIGNFYNDVQTEMEILKFRHGRSEMLSGSCYFYVDDVKVESLNSLQSLPHNTTVFKQDTIKKENSFILDDVLFFFDDFKLKESSFITLDSIAGLMQTNSAWKANIQGHTDDLGIDAYNYRLSIKRAESVRSYLMSKGVAGSRIFVEGFGEKLPMTISEGSKHLNRRVEIKFIIE